MAPNQLDSSARGMKSACFRIALRLGRPAICLFLVLSSLPNSLLFAQPETFRGPLTGVNRDQVVLLDNGAVMLGTVTRTPTQVIVKTDQGSRIVLSHNKIDLIADSLQDAYWQQAIRTSVNDISGQVELFQWCLKHSLTRQAENQITALMHTEINPIQLGQLQRQLTLEIKRNQRAAKQYPSLAAKAQVPDVDTPGPNSVRVPAQSPGFVVAREPWPVIAESEQTGTFQAPRTPVTNHNPIRQVAFEEDLESPAAKRDANDSPAESVGLETFELEASLRSLPRGTVGQFRRSIEPMLLKSCFAARCHDGDSDLTFMRMPGGNPLRYSQRNLHSILEHLDRNNLAHSKLWLAATQPHANMEHPILSRDSREYRALVTWVNTLALGSSAPSGIQFASSPEPQQFEHNPTNAKPEWINRIPSIQPPQQTSQVSQSKPLTPLADIPTLDASDSPLGRYVPVDPYDPEVFNRLPISDDDGE